jgi:leucyl aminopeptidase
VLNIRLAVDAGTPGRLALPVDGSGTLAATAVPLPAEMIAEAEAFRADRDHSGRAGLLHALPRPLRAPERLLLVGVGDGTEAGWRAAGAAIVRASLADGSVTLLLPPGADPATVRGAAEGALLAGYRYRLGADDGSRLLGEIVLVVSATGTLAGYEEALRIARSVAEATILARDLVNTPSEVKTPQWFTEQISTAAAAHPGLTVSIRATEQLAAEGFGGILAVGSGSTRGPRLLELSWQPEGAGPHVVLVGKGITFDTGGIAVKPRDGMKLMRKDMGGAAAVTAAVVGAAALRLPVRVTALAPLAENMLSGTAYRPGDVVRHYGGLTSEIFNTDAEGRVVLGDALAYAADRLAPDLLVDLATLTGAATVALGKRTAALYSENDELAAALRDAAEAAGELVWRMPLAEEYRYAIDGEIADLHNAPQIGAGSVTAALFLREFTGPARDRWAHLDMSAPAWADGNDGELSRGATGWGVRTLLRWLATVAVPAPATR